MAKVIDTFGAIPDRAILASWLSGFCRFEGYLRMFGRTFAGLSGGRTDDLDRPRADDERRALIDGWLDALAPLLPPLDDYVGELDALGVEAVGVWVHVEPGAGRAGLNRLIECRAAHPGRFFPIVSYEPTIPDLPDVIERDHRASGLAGVGLLPIIDDRPADDPANWPVYEACLELDLPVWIHTVNTWSERHPSEFCHPRHADRVACAFPDLRIVIGHGGWPWVREAVAVAWRHPNVYLEPSAFRYKHLAAAGSGWEPLLYYGDRTIADKVLFGSLWPLVGVTLAQAVDEVRALPLKSETIAKWTHDNARRFYGL